MVNRTRLGLMSQAFTDHFRVDENVAVQGIEYELPWSELRQLVAPTPAEGVKNGVKFIYGLKNGTFSLALSPLRFMAPVKDTVFPYVDTSSDVYMLLGRVLTKVPREDWMDEYHEGGLFRTGRYLREMEIKRFSAGDFEKIKTSDASAEVFAWEDELLRMHDQTIPYLDPRDSILYAVVRCVSEPDEALIAPSYPYKHRLCIFLRKWRTDGSGYRDLLDDKMDYRTSDSSAALPFRMKGADFGNLCPPSCDTYTLTKDVP